MAKVIKRKERLERLDVPGPLRRRERWIPTFDADMFGSFAERFARFMGTGQFLIWMTIFITVWLWWNISMPENLQFDPKSLNFTLLTLILSLQASYAAPLILLATNRQEARERISLEEDRRVASQARDDMDFLAREIAGLRQSVGDLATREFLRAELRDLLEELEEQKLEQLYKPAVGLDTPRDAHE